MVKNWMHTGPTQKEITFFEILILLSRYSSVYSLVYNSEFTI